MTQDIDMTYTRRCVHWLLALAILALAGCYTGPPFMGVSEWRSRNYEDDDPRTPLQGVVKMTAVRSAEYKDYISAMAHGRVVARQQRDDTMYFAVASQQYVTLKDPETDQPVAAMVGLIERYCATVPPALQPITPPKSKTPTVPAAGPKTPPIPLAGPRTAPATTPKTVTPSAP
jgi:hypothetical protein